MRRSCLAARLAATALSLVLLAAALPVRRASAAAPAEETFTIQRVQASINDMLYDPVGGKVYMSLPSSTDGSGNTVVAFDPATGVYGAPVHVGSEPGPLAVTDNGQYLYVGLQGSAAVRRVNLANQTADLFWWLGNKLSPNDVTPTVDGPFTPQHLAAVPGRPDCVAVAQGPGVAVYRDGVKLPKSFGEFLLPFFDIFDIGQLAFDPASNAAYSIPIESGNFVKLSYDEQGVTPVSRVPYHQLTGSNYVLFAFDDGLIYTGKRQVVDPKTATVVATFPGETGQNFDTFPAPDAALGRIAFLSGSTSTTLMWTVSVYDQRTRELVGSFGIPNFTGSVKRFIRWGTNGLAFLTREGQLFVIRTSLLSPAGGVALPQLSAPPKPTLDSPAFNVRTLALPNNDLVYDPARGLIHASVPANSPSHANSVAAIDPVAGAVVSSIPVGTDPGKLAISSTGGHLYVALNAEEAVRRVNLASGVAEPPFSIKGRGTSPLYAIDMEVLPDDPGKVLIPRLHINGPFRQFLTMLYWDNGVFRLPRFDGNTGTVEMSDTPGIGYAASGGLSGVHYSVFEVGLNSYTALRVVNNVMGGGYTPDFTYQDGLLFTPGGTVGDPARALRLGRNVFPVEPLEHAQVAPDPRAERAYYLIGGPPLSGNSPTTWTVRAYDLRTFLPVWSLKVPGVVGDASPLIRWGANGLAFGTSGGQLFLIDSPAIAAPPTAPTTLQLDAPEVRVNEGAGEVRLNVTRTGPLFTGATVNYRTADRSANAAGDYAAASGTLHFAPGESSKTLTLHVNDDRLAEGEEAFEVVLSSPLRAALGRSTAAVVVQDDDAASGPSPVGDAAFDTDFFVRQHYVDFLGREPDASGARFWTGEIENCGSNQQCREVKRINVSAAFFVSIEFQQTGYYVYRLYQAAYGRRVGGAVPLRLEEFLPDTSAVAQGVVVGQGYWETNLRESKRNFATAFAARPEFRQAYPDAMTGEQFVDKLNANAGGVLTSDERRILIFILDNNQTSRADVLYQVAEKAAFQQREFNRAFVLMQYFGYLRRDPDRGPDTDFTGFNFWLKKLEDFSGNYIAAEMVKAFISSDEYRKRFGQ